MGAVRTPGVYPPRHKLHAGWPMPLMISTTTQSHANTDAEGQFLRIGQSKHHTPNARSPRLIARNPLSDVAVRSIEHLDPRILTIDYENAACRVDRNAMRQIELAGPLSLRAPLRKKSSIARELHHPAVPAAVADIERAVRRDRNISGTVEMRAVCPGDSAFSESQQQLTVARELVDLMQSDTGRITGSYRADP